MKNDEPDAGYIRCTCLHCGQRLEFPANAGGSKIKCPVCGRSTQIHRTPDPSPAERSQPKVHFEGAAFARNQKVFAWALGALVIAIIAAFSILQPDKSPDFGNYNPQPSHEDNMKEWESRLTNADEELYGTKPETDELIHQAATNLQHEK